MSQLTVEQYESLEQSVTKGQRVALYRRGTEYIVIPQRIHTTRGREAVEALHPTTGERMTFFLDELDRFEVVR